MVQKVAGSRPVSRPMLIFKILIKIVFWFNIKILFLVSVVNRFGGVAQLVRATGS